MNIESELFDPDSEIKELMAYLNQESIGVTKNEDPKREPDQVSFLERSPRFFRPINYIFNLVDAADVNGLTGYLKSHPEAVIRSNDLGESPLHHAVSFSNPTQTRLEIIKILLRNGAILTSRDLDQKTAIHNAAQSSRAVNALELLIAHANDLDLPDILDMQDNRGMCALHYALQSGRLESVECLLLSGASLDIRENSKNATPLLRCFFGAPDMRMVEKVFSVVLAYSDFQGFDGWIQWDINSEDSDGNTLLHAACNLGSIRLVHALLWCGAIADKQNKNGHRPIDFLKDPSSADSKKIIQYLTNIPAVKLEPLLLVIPETKLFDISVPRSRENYLAGLRSLVDIPLAVVAQNQRSSSDISSPSRFLVRHSTLPNLSGELPVLRNRLMKMLDDFPTTSSEFLQSEQHLHSVDGELESQLNFKSYQARYQSVFSLQESSEVVIQILVIPRMRLETDSAFCYLVLERYTKLRESISKEIARLIRQVSAIEGFVERDIESGHEKMKNIANMSDQELKSIFSPIDITTVKAVYKDKFALDFFKAGFLQKLSDMRKLSEKYSAVNQFFMCIQKCISLIEYCHQYYKVISSNDAFLTDKAPIDHLKLLFDQAFERGLMLDAGEEVPSSISSSALGKK